MRRRVWSTVIVTAALLLFASSAWSAWPEMNELMWPRAADLIAQVENLPWTVVLLAAVACVMWMVSLVKLYRTWMVRRNLVRVLARFGTPTSVIANTARLSQDGVAFLTASAGGNGVHQQREVFSGTGNQFTPFQTLQPSHRELVSSNLAKT